MEGHLRLSYCTYGQRYHGGGRAHQMGARSEFSQRNLHWRPQACEGLAMIGNIWNIKTPAHEIAKERASEFKLSNHGLTNLGVVYWNLTLRGALWRGAVPSRRQLWRTWDRWWSTPANTRHAPPMTNSSSAKQPPRTTSGGDNTTVRSAPTDSPASTTRLQAYLQGRDLFVQDCYVGADPNYQMPIRVITEFAWHSLFARNMFIKIDELDELKRLTSRFHDHLDSVIPGDAFDRRHADADVHSAQLRAAPGDHRRHRLRRRDQEIGLHDSELPAAAAGHHVDALLRQRRQRW